MALGGEAVLVAARHAALGSDVFRSLAHVPAFEGAPEAVVHERVDHLLIAELPTATCSGQQIRCSAHAFHAARDQHLGIVGADGLGGQHHRLEP